MQDFEKLGAFYLGRAFDLEKNQPSPDLVLYDSRDLVTHAVCVGMTGSGKTGLCIGLLEEAAIDGIPSIIIDPKGDLSNLLLTFPALRGADLLPWVNEEDAAKKGLSTEQYAEEQAEKWKKGLADFGQDPSRIQRLRDAAEFAVYTPGSTAGIPVSILKSLSAPDRVVLADAELLRERINTTVTSLLGLLGVDANPMSSREHILLSTLFDVQWKQGISLDLPALIAQVQNPPVSRIGVFDLESFYPSKDRFQLAMMMNNLLAAPGFELWTQGAALDPASLLYTPAGKPRVCIFSISHLSDGERMFFVSLLLTQMLGWMRTQSGTGSLRALLYMDEVFGYFPPVANPPSKTPLLTLLKQARAFGLGVVLATQNPVDLDYKGLANAGTWFIGRLQTEQDKARLLDGLEGAQASARFDRARMESVLSNLQSRVFLMNNVHEDEPRIFQTRWTLSYLRGPLTRTQLQKLSPRPDSPAAGSQAPPVIPAAAADAPAAAPGAAAASSRPMLPPDVPQYFLPVRSWKPDAQIVYKPGLLCQAAVYYADAKAGVAHEQQITVLLKLSAGKLEVDWANAQAVDVALDELEKFPAEDASYAELGSEAAQPRNYPRWNKSFADWVFRTQSLPVLKSPSLGHVSKAGESERDFRIRLQQMGREERDRAVEQLRKKYAPKLAALQERIRKAEQAVARETEQARDSKMQTAISFGSTVLGALFGRKTFSATNLGRATTAARGVGRSMRESQDIDRAQNTVQAMQEQFSSLESEMQTEVTTLETSMDPQSERLETMELKPKKTNISIKLLALVWTPELREQK